MKKIKTNIGEIIELPITDLELHELAHEHPKMSDSEFNRLKESIEEIGQQEEILVYRNKIIDGRHRYWAMKELNFATIRAKILPYNTPIETVKEIVLGSDVRRHKNPTQKAIEGWKATQTEGMSLREAESKFMTSRTMISKCNYIAKHRGEQLLNDLYNQIPVVIGTKSTTNIDALKKFIEKEEETAEMVKRLERKPYYSEQVVEASLSYLTALKEEPTAVVEYVTKGAYSILKRRK